MKAIACIYTIVPWFESGGKFQIYYVYFKFYMKNNLIKYVFYQKMYSVHCTPFDLY